MRDVRITAALQFVMFLILYNPGPAWEKGRPTKEQPFLEHGRYMLDLHERGIMKDAGPFVGHEG